MKTLSAFPLILLHIICCLVLMFGNAGTAAAQKSLSESTYKQLTKVHELMQKEDYAEALAKLNALRPRVQHNGYEQAVVLQTYSHLYVAMERYALAIESIEQSLALQSLPEDVTRNLLYLSAQLRIAEGDNAGALVDLERWFSGETEPQPAPHALAGVAYSRLEEYPAAIQHLEVAVNTGLKPQELHMRQLLAVYLLAQRNREAAGLLQRIITSYPGRSADWRQLSAIYRQLGDDRKALAVMELAYRQGMLNSAQDLLGLVNYYLYLDAPREAAKLLASLLKKGLLTPNREHWELLAAAWTRSRETLRAIHALSRAASLENDPELHLKRAQLAAAVEDWDQVLMAVADIQRADSLSQFAEVHLLAGIAHHRRGEISSAREAFLPSGETCGDS